MKNKLVMPVVKWVGGKRQLLNEIESRLPDKYATYYEPFFGGGAVLFHLQPKKAVINDYNKDLINTYRVIKDNHLELIESLKLHENNSDYFYRIRDKDRDSKKYINMTLIEKSSRLIYLNKTCYNGLFRVNSSGQFNTPFANYKNPNIVNEPVIKAIHKYFSESEITIMDGDFKIALEGVQENDFVYLDPPYDPVSDTASFTGYSDIGFSQDDQIRLRDVCIELNNKGAKFMLSNSATNNIRTLYKDFYIDTVKAKRIVNSDATKRGEVDELIIRNYR